MLDVRKIRQSPQEVRDALKSRNQTVSIDPFLMLDEQRRTLLAQVEEKKTLRNQKSKQLGLARKKGASDDELAVMMDELRVSGDEIEALDAQISTLNEQSDAFLLTLPNLPHTSVPVGDDARSNVPVRITGTPRDFVWEPKTHDELLEDLHLVHTGTASEPVLRALGARLHHALEQFLLSAFSQDGYEQLVLSPAVASIPAVYQDEIFSSAYLPVCSCALQPSRTGVELCRIGMTDQSFSALEAMTAAMEKALVQMGLCVRISELCTGCLDFSASKAYAVEVWMPGRQDYVTAGICSDCSDFSARRNGLRFRREPKEKPRAAHTVSGEISIRSIFDAVLENFQNDDGTVSIPDCLISAMRTGRIHR